MLVVLISFRFRHLSTRRIMYYFFFSSRRRHTRSDRDWSSDVCSSDLHSAFSFFRSKRRSVPCTASQSRVVTRTNCRACDRGDALFARRVLPCTTTDAEVDRKSTRLNSSHDQISYAVFCLKKKKKTNNT